MLHKHPDKASPFAERSSAPRSESYAGTVFTVFAVFACVSMTVLTAVALEPRPLQILLFAIAAAAFTSNLTVSLPSIVRPLAVLVQGICVFEVLGFSVGLTVIAIASRGAWDTPPWWSLVAAWGSLTACLGALVFSASLALRAFASQSARDEA